jgi:hypothetical protein
VGLLVASLDLCQNLLSVGSLEPMAQKYYFYPLSILSMAT